MVTKRTLEEILQDEKAKAHYQGEYGLDACKQSILDHMEYQHKSLFQLLEEYLTRANKDIFFNNAMVLACWELINGR